MVDAVLVPLEHLMTTWWLYPVLFGLCCVDAFLPVFPSEAPLILAGVYASDARGPHLLGVVIVAMLGASMGDHASYGVGRLVGPRLLRTGSRRRRASLERVTRILHERGAWALLVVRFVPGGRSIATMSLGAACYPLRARFTPYDLLATGLWALHGCVIGYAGGHAFEGNPVAGVVTGLLLALVVAACLEGVQRVRRRSGAQ